MTFNKRLWGGIFFIIIGLIFTSNYVVLGKHTPPVLLGAILGILVGIGLIKNCRD